MPDRITAKPQTSYIRRQLRSYLHDYQLSIAEVEVNTELGHLLKNSDDTNAIFLQHLSGRPSDSLSFFTDGSKNHVNESIGSACFFPELNLFSQICLQKYMVSFTAECIEINTALDIAFSCSQGSIYIYSDCLSALQSLNKGFSNVNTNFLLFDVKKCINHYLSSSRKLFFFWIPAHIGTSSNEKVDIYAKKAAQLETSSNILVPSFDFSHIFRSSNRNRVIYLKLNSREPSFSRLSTKGTPNFGSLKRIFLETLYVALTDFVLTITIWFPHFSGLISLMILNVSVDIPSKILIIYCGNAHCLTIIEMY